MHALPSPKWLIEQLLFKILNKKVIDHVNLAASERCRLLMVLWLKKFVKTNYLEIADKTVSECLSQKLA